MLGPLFLFIYIDNIIRDIESDIFLFADDTSILEKITDAIISFESIFRDLSKLDA